MCLCWSGLHISSGKQGTLFFGEKEKGYKGEEIRIPVHWKRTPRRRLMLCGDSAGKQAEESGGGFIGYESPTVMQ